jgi:hypothetical protein
LRFNALLAGCFDDHCQYTPLLNLRPLVCDLTPFGWLHSITLTPAYSIISYGNIFFFRPLDLRPPHQEDS